MERDWGECLRRVIQNHIAPMFTEKYFTAPLDRLGPVSQRFDMQNHSVVLGHLPMPIIRSTAKARQLSQSDLDLSLSQHRFVQITSQFCNILLKLIPIETVSPNSVFILLRMFGNPRPSPNSAVPCHI